MGLLGTPARLTNEHPAKSIPVYQGQASLLPLAQRCVTCRHRAQQDPIRTRYRRARFPSRIQGKDNKRLCESSSSLRADHTAGRGWLSHYSKRLFRTSPLHPNRLHGCGSHCFKCCADTSECDVISFWCSYIVRPYGVDARGCRATEKRLPLFKGTCLQHFPVARSSRLRVSERENLPDRPSHTRCPRKVP